MDLKWFRRSRRNKASASVTAWRSCVRVRAWLCLCVCVCVCVCLDECETEKERQRERESGRQSNWILFAAFEWSPSGREERKSWAIFWAPKMTPKTAPNSAKPLSFPLHLILIFDCVSDLLFSSFLKKPFERVSFKRWNQSKWKKWKKLSDFQISTKYFFFISCSK